MLYGMPEITPTVAAAFALMDAYMKQYPELGIRDLFRSSEMVGGIKVSWEDDRHGHLTLRGPDDQVVLSLDMTPWVAPREA